MQCYFHNRFQRKSRKEMIRVNVKVLQVMLPRCDMLAYHFCLFYVSHNAIRPYYFSHEI